MKQNRFSLSFKRITWEFNIHNGMKSKNMSRNLQLLQTDACNSCF